MEWLDKTQETLKLNYQHAETYCNLIKSRILDCPPLCNAAEQFLAENSTTTEAACPLLKQELLHKYALRGTQMYWLQQLGRHEAYLAQSNSKTISEERSRILNRTSLPAADRCKWYLSGF